MEFVKELRTHFGPANPVGSAEIKLRHLIMASNTRLAEYLVCFNTLASHVGWGEQALRFQFYDGLPECLKDQLAMLGKPDLLRKLVQVTQCYDNLYWERQEERRLARLKDNKLAASMHLRAPTTPNQPTNQAHECVLGPDSKLKLEEWKHHCENHLCMICSKANHGTAMCPAATRGHAAILEELQETPDRALEEQGTKDPPESGQVN